MSSFSVGARARWPPSIDSALEMAVDPRTLTRRIGNSEDIRNGHGKPPAMSGLTVIWHGRKGIVDKVTFDAETTAPFGERGTPGRAKGRTRYAHIAVK